MNIGSYDGTTILGMVGMGSNPVNTKGWHHYCWIFDNNIGSIQYYYDGNYVGRHIKMGS